MINKDISITYNNLEWKFIADLLLISSDLLKDMSPSLSIKLREANEKLVLSFTAEYFTDEDEDNTRLGISINE